MAAAFVAGRLLFGGFFLINGLNLLIAHAMFTNLAAAKGVPLPGAAVAVAGALIVFGGISILLGWQPDLGIAAIVVFLIPVTFFMHNFWALSGLEQVNELGHFMKNLALLGAALVFSVVPRPWVFSIDRPKVGA